MRQLAKLLSLGCLSTLFLISCSSKERPAYTNNVIAAAQPLASKAVEQMYALGGNAFDAAVAAGFTLAVVEPSMSGLGGRLQAIYQTQTGEIAGVDASTEVPKNYTPSTVKHSFGYPTIGIPGVVAGLLKLHQDKGSLPLTQVLAPAIKAAEEGYAILPGEAYRQQMALDKVKTLSGTAYHFLNEKGEAPEAGDIIVQKDLAEVLKAIAKKGKKGFYEGDVAQKMVDDIQANGGILTLEDLKNYKALSSRVLHGKYYGHDIHSLYLPSYGAITIQILQILDHLKGIQSEEQWAQEVGEATKIAYTYRKKQDNQDSLALILSYAHAGKLAQQIREEAYTFTADFDQNTPVSWTVKQGHTSHLTAVDQWGNAVSLTQTVGPNMGSKVATKGLGFLYAVTLGGYLGDYKPGDRANSHITPTLVSKEGALVLALGAAGGSRIVTALTQVISRFLGQKNPLDKAVFLPRVYPFQDSLWVEDHATVKAVNADLNPAEYPVKYIEEIARFGRVHAIAKDPESASWVGAADPDWEGTTEYFSSEKKD